MRSLSRIVKSANGSRRISGKILRLARGSGPGYQMATLSRKGKTKSYLAHRLVLDAFVGLRPKGKEACHFDGDASNNHINNLRWGTKKSNRADTERLSRTAKGEKNGNSKLSNEERKEIIKLKGILPIHRIASLYNIWPSTVNYILKTNNKQER